MPTVLLVVVAALNGRMDLEANLTAAATVAQQYADHAPPAWQQQRIKRDGQHVHMTFLSKGDLQLLMQSGMVHVQAEVWEEAGATAPDPTDILAVSNSIALVLAKLPRCWDWVDVGTGFCKDDCGESVFRVVLWPAAAAVRKKLGLPAKDFHITLGFQGSDVHSKAKGLTSLRAAPSNAASQRLTTEAFLLSSAISADAFPLYQDSMEQVTSAALLGSGENEASEVDALRVACLFYGRVKRFDQVLASSDRLLQLQSGDETGCRSRAFALVMLSRYEEAVSALELARSQLHTLPPEQHAVEHARVLKALSHCQKKLGAGYPGSATGLKHCLAEGVGKANYPKTPHLPFSPGINPDDTRVSDCQNLLSREVVITEKLDGGNCCIKADVESQRLQVFGRTHAQPAEHASFSAVKELAACIEYDELGDVEIFGENMQAVHSIEYGSLTNYFYVFAARRSGDWLCWDETRDLAKRLGLATVPEVFRGALSEGELQGSLEQWQMEPSALDAKKTPEGFVVRHAAAIPGGSFAECIGKFVRANHIQTDESWKRTWKKACLGKEMPHQVKAVQADGDICLYTASGDLALAFPSGHKQAIVQMTVSPMQDEYVVATVDSTGVMRVHRLFVRPRRGPQEQRRRVTNPDEEKCEPAVTSLHRNAISQSVVLKYTAMVVSPAWPAEILMPNAASCINAQLFDPCSQKDPCRQMQVNGDIEKARSAQEARGHFNMPSPRDCKATMLQGSGTVQVTDGSP
ncbi:unnamed protein product, partial [Symbiodinium sp. CCMP2592]